MKRHRPETGDTPAETPKQTTPAQVVGDDERVLERLEHLPLKARARLLDRLRSTAYLEREDGLRYSVESTAEYKRARKQIQADVELERWIGTFGSADVFYDVGANTGAASMRAARMHQGRVRVFAFEPAFDTFGSLVRNILANALGDAITPLQVALFDATGVRPFHRSAAGAGTALHAVGEALDYGRNPFTPSSVEPVLAFRLDDLVSMLKLPLPTRMKLDVDGFEHKVLAGGTEMLTRARCEVYTEMVEARAGDPHPADVTRFMHELGYEIRQIVEHRPPGVYPRIFDALFVSRA